MISEKTIAIYTAYAHKLLNARPELLELLQRNRNRMVVFGLEDQDIGENVFAPSGIQYFKIPINRHGLSISDEIRGSRIIADELRRNKVDILLTYGIRLIISANRGAKNAGTPVINIINGAGTLFADNSSKGKIRRKMILPILKASFSKANRVIFQNSDDLKEFSNLKLVQETKCGLTNGSGVNLQKFVFSELPESHVFGFDCRLSKEKGIKELIQAFRKLKKEYSNVKLCIAGGMDGLEMTDIYQLFTEAISNDEIEYLGEINDISGFLHNCRCFVYPSYYREGVPRSIMEAMACGRPIITTDMPGCRETVVDGYNGYIIPPRNVESLYVAMKKICEEENNCQNMGLASRHLVEEKYDVNMNNIIICNYLEDCIR